MNRDSLCAERLKSALLYEAGTGVFFWRNTFNRVMAGDIAGTERYGYVVISINGFKYRAHRLAWLYVFGKWPDGVIDHINHDRGDNRISNLRDVTVAINTQNQCRANADSKTGILGATKHALCNKYVAQITINNKRKYLGLYDTAKLAHEAYVKAKREHHSGCTI